MGKKAFETSLDSGHHAELARLVGDWSGTLRVWFEAGDPVSDATVRGRIRSVLGGRFVLHEYESQCMGEAEQGIAIHGYHVDALCYESAWIDSFHTDTQIMVSRGVPMATLHAVTASYGSESDGAAWGWRTEIGKTSADKLLIRMFNITSQGEESLAMEFAYRRVHASRAV